MSTMPQPTERVPAPGRLKLVQDFVNTIDYEERQDEIGTPAALKSWLGAHRLSRGPARVGPAEVVRVARVREALRRLLYVNNGAHPDAEAAAVLDRAARGAQLEVRFSANGDAYLAPCAQGVDGALGAILAVVHTSVVDGSWNRLKACPAEQCGWAFFDSSRNRSSTWCSMQTCGNREKVRTFRLRHAHGKKPKAAPRG